MKTQITTSRKIKFAVWELIMVLYKLMIFPQMRVWFLRLCGAKIGKGTIIMGDVSFINLYHKGFKGLNIGRECYIGTGCLLDLYDSIILGNQVTLAPRVTILTHTNVGWDNHPIQKIYPTKHSPIIILHGSFIGINSTIMNNVGYESVVGAGSLVNKPVQLRLVVAGVPAREIRKLYSQQEQNHDWVQTGSESSESLKSAGEKQTRTAKLVGAGQTPADNYIEGEVYGLA